MALKVSDSVEAEASFQLVDAARARARRSAVVS